MKELVSYIVSELIEFKDEMEVIESENLIKIVLAKPDMGKVIGKQGKIIKAIRSIIKAASMKDNRKITVDVIEKENA